MLSLMSDSYHKPVMLNESVDGLQIDPEGIYIDLTFGGGGHSEEILSRLNNGKLYAFDQDADAKLNAALFKSDPRFVFIESNFRYVIRYLKMYKVTKVNGILMDLGVSSHQIDSPERGFSIRYDALLDMRMNRESGKTARDILSTYSESALQAIFSMYGEIRNAKSLANAVVKSRGMASIDTSNQLSEIARGLAPRGREVKYLARVFQALRIEVNQEIDALEDALIQSVDLLASGGRLVVISYHSLEDRLAKHFMRYGNLEGRPEKDLYGNLIRPFTPVNRKPITATLKELESNRRSRSAKLRIAERI